AGASAHRGPDVGRAAHLVARRLRRGGPAVRAPGPAVEGPAARARQERGRGHRLRRAFMALALVLASCSSNATPTPTGAGGSAAATFILANPAGLLCLDDAARILGRVVALPPTSAPALPSLSPDHKQVLFALTSAPDPKTGFGTDIDAVNLDGTNLHAVVPHE